MSPWERRALAVVLVGALALRLLFVFGQRDDILFSHPFLDEDRYVSVAVGRAVEDRPYWQPPGIIYALAATFRVAGNGLLAPRVLQALVGTASCLLVFLLGRRWFGGRVAIAAAAIVAVHGVLIFESYELLPPTWQLFFDLAALWALQLAGERASAPLSFAAGLALGTSAVFAPTILPFVLVAVVWLRRPRPIAALLAGVILPIAPVTIRNWEHGHEAVLVSTNGGLNLFLGNNARYRETFALRPGRRWIELTAEAERHGVTRPGAASSYYADKALAFWRDDPAGAVALLLRKEYLFFHGAEIPRNNDFYAIREGSLVLRALVGPRGLWFPNGLLAPLALLGVAVCWGERRRLWLLYGFLGVQAAIIPLFFVTARHRVPALAAFALFGAAAAAALGGRWRSESRRWRAGWVAAATALVVALNVPTWESSLNCSAELDFYRGLALRKQRRPDEAVDALRRAVASDPADARFAFELGNTLDGLGRSDEALASWQLAAAADPGDSRPRRSIAAALTRRGDLDGAIAALEANVAAGQHEPAHYAPDQVNLAELHARRGRFADAIGALRACQRADRAVLADKLPGLTRSLLDTVTGDAAFWQALGDLNDEVGAAETARAARARAASMRP